MRAPQLKGRAPPAISCDLLDAGLAAAGKKPKVILVMRKMITTLKAMLRDGAGWQPQAA